MTAMPSKNKSSSGSDQRSRFLKAKNRYTECREGSAFSHKMKHSCLHKTSVLLPACFSTNYRPPAKSLRKMQIFCPSRWTRHTHGFFRFRKTVAPSSFSWNKTTDVSSTLMCSGAFPGGIRAAQKLYHFHIAWTWFVILSTKKANPFVVPDFGSKKKPLWHLGTVKLNRFGTVLGARFRHSKWDRGSHI